MSEYVPDEMPASVGEQWRIQSRTLLGGWVVPDEIIGFTAMMREVDSEFSVGSFLEKPHHWEQEMAVWLAAGKPDLDELSAEEYDAFVARLEVAS